MPDQNISIEPVIYNVDIIETINKVELASPGPQGPKGDPTPFNVGLVSFNYEQQSLQSEWLISHNLGFRPAVSVMDYSKNNIECDIEHINENLVKLIFSSPNSGYAYLS